MVFCVSIQVVNFFCSSSLKNYFGNLIGIIEFVDCFGSIVIFTILIFLITFVLIKLGVLNHCVGSESARNSTSMRHHSTVVRTGSGLPGIQAWPWTSSPHFILFCFFLSAFFSLLIFFFLIIFY